MNNIINKVKEKYNYSDELCSFLEKAVSALIEFYGEDKIDFIEKALMDSEIHIQEENENAKDYLNNYFDVDYEWDFPFTAGAMQHREIKKEEDGLSSISIIYIRTINMRRYTPCDLNDPKKQSAIIHEICHAMKSTRDLEIDGDKIISHTGVADELYSIDDNNKVNEAGQNRMGLEEALNSYEEASVMSIIRGEKQEYGAYKNLTDIARLLLEDEELKRLIVNGQFYGDKEWISYLGDDYKTIIDDLDIILATFYVSPGELMNNSEEIISRRDNAIDSFLAFYNNRKKKNELDSMFEEEEKVEENSYTL